MTRVLLFATWMPAVLNAGICVVTGRSCSLTCPLKPCARTYDIQWFVEWLKINVLRRSEHMSVSISLLTQCGGYYLRCDGNIHSSHSAPAYFWKITLSSVALYSSNRLSVARSLPVSVSSRLTLFLKKSILIIDLSDISRVCCEPVVCHYIIDLHVAWECVYYKYKRQTF